MARLQVRCLPSVQPAWSRCPTHARASWQLRHLKQVTSTLIQSFHALEVTFHGSLWFLNVHCGKGRALLTGGGWPSAVTHVDT